MNACPPELASRLLYILYRGWVEARSRTLNPQQEFDLADAMHNIPGFLADWHDDYLDMIREDLRAYQSKYTEACHDYLSFLECSELPYWPPKWNQQEPASQVHEQR
jgi:hypothetical protein